VGEEPLVPQRELDRLAGPDGDRGRRKRHVVADLQRHLLSAVRRDGRYRVRAGGVVRGRGAAAAGAGEGDGSDEEDGSELLSHGVISVFEIPRGHFRVGTGDLAVHP
jgi:hypothetical protein